MKKLRLSCFCGGRSSIVLFAGAIPGFLIACFAAAFASIGDSDVGFFQVFIPIFVGFIVLVTLLVHFSAYRLTRDEKEIVRSMEPVEWKIASERDLEEAAALHGFDWALYIGFAVGLVIFSVDEMFSNGEALFVFIACAVVAVPLFIFGIYQIAMKMFWSKTDTVLTEYAEFDVRDDYSVNERQRYRTNKVRYLVILTPEGKFMLKQYDKTYNCKKVRILRRGNKYTYVQAGKPINFNRGGYDE